MKLFKSLSIISAVTLTFGLKCWFKIKAHSSLNYTFGLSMSHIGQKEENIHYKPVSWTDIQADGKTDK